MLCPPRWACLRSCLPPCLPSGLGCCVRLAGLVFLLSAVLSPVLSAISAGWAVSGLVSQLVSHLVWDALSVSIIWDAVSAPPGLVFFLSLVLSPICLGCCVRLLGSSPSPASGLLSHPVFQLVWCVRALGLSPKFHVRFVQLLGVYGGVIFYSSLFQSFVIDVNHFCFCLPAFLYFCTFIHLFFSKYLCIFVSGQRHVVRLHSASRLLDFNEMTAVFSKFRCIFLREMATSCGTFSLCYWTVRFE